MTCKEIHEQITAYVDDRVDEQEYRRKIEQHITYCPECRAAYEAELLTKMVVRDSYARTPASDSLRTSISGNLDRMSAESRKQMESQDNRHSRRDWIDSFAANYLSPAGIAIALFIVLAGGVYLYTSGQNDSQKSYAVQQGVPAPVADTTTASRPANFFNKATQNFQAIVAGQLPLQFETSDAASLKDYFSQQGVGYDVIFAQVKVPLAGGVVSRHDGTPLAHMVYSKGETLLYVFEVPESVLRQGKIVYVTEDVLARLNAGEPIWVEESPQSAQVMYKQGDVVLAVVGNVPRTTMHGLLSMR